MYNFNLDVRKSFHRGFSLYISFYLLFCLHLSLEFWKLTFIWHCLDIKFESNQVTVVVLFSPSVFSKAEIKRNNTTSWVVSIYRIWTYVITLINVHWQLGKPKDFSFHVSHVSYIATLGEYLFISVVVLKARKRKCYSSR